MKCTKCGAENNEDAKFCSNCGSELIKPKLEKFACPKCGNVFEGRINFCPKCGLKFAYPDCDLNAIPHPVGEDAESPKEEPDNKPDKEAVKEEKKAVAAKPSDEKVLNKPLLIVELGLFILFIFMSMIGVWGAFASADGYNVGVSYWFGDGWGVMDSDFMAQKAIFILGFLSFISALCFTFIAGTIALVKLITSLVKNKKQDFKNPLTLTIVGLLSYFLFAYSMMALKQGNVGVSYGWGELLVMIPLVLVLLYRNVKKYIENAKDLEANLASYILESIALVMFIVVMFVSRFHFGFESVQSSATWFLCYISGTMGDSSILALIVSILAVISLITYIILFSSLMGKAANDEKTAKFGYLSFGFLLVTFALTTVSMLIFNSDEVGVSVNAIVSCVLLLAASIVATISEKLKKR